MLSSFHYNYGAQANSPDLFTVLRNQISFMNGLCVEQQLQNMYVYIYIYMYSNHNEHMKNIKPHYTSLWKRKASLSHLFTTQAKGPRNHHPCLEVKTIW